MCGRYTIYTDADERELLEILRVIEANSKNKPGIDFKTGEIFPTDRVPLLVRGNKGGMNIVLSNWGYSLYGKTIINARRETVSEKNIFRNSLAAQRCVIPSTGFYEWNKQKTKYLFNLPDTKMLYMAGLWRWMNNNMEFVIITAEANESVLSVHNRMPLVLTRNKIESWLCDDENTKNISDFTLPELQKIAV
ncbi:MAG: SOS response-associated peptidase [Eubacteriales bacterium]|nr:SOS response-associated peptidase [Eubacteriales bacterium]